MDIDRAQDIVSGRDPATEQDLSTWCNLGGRSEHTKGTAPKNTPP